MADLVDKSLSRTLATATATATRTEFLTLVVAVRSTPDAFYAIGQASSAYRCNSVTYGTSARAPCYTLSKSLGRFGRRRQEFVDVQRKCLLLHSWLRGRGEVSWNSAPRATPNTGCTVCTVHGSAPTIPTPPSPQLLAKPTPRRHVRVQVKPTALLGVVEVEVALMTPKKAFKYAYEGRRGPMVAKLRLAFARLAPCQPLNLPPEIESARYRNVRGC